MSENRFDLHMHSSCSDGFDPPAQVVRNAAGEGVRLMALTDHDSVQGVPEAREEGERQGVVVLPAIEMDCEWSSELHMLGLDIDPEHPRLRAALDKAAARRVARNREIIARLSAAGYDIAPYLTRAGSSVTRLHIALALVDAGFAQDTRDAFARYLLPGRPGYYKVERFSPEEVIGLVLAAGGVPVWAHPCHARGNIRALGERLRAWGLMGLEVYHPSATAGESELLLSMARQMKLLASCGSDCHGANKPGVRIGCTWRPSPELEQTRAFFLARRAGAHK